MTLAARRAERDTLRARFLAADMRVTHWGKACKDPNKHLPTAVAEYGIAFDARERHAKAYQLAFPISYCQDRPLSAFAVRHLLPAGLAAAIEAAETDDETVAALTFVSDFA